MVRELHVGHGPGHVLHGLSSSVHVLHGLSSGEHELPGHMLHGGTVDGGPGHVVISQGRVDIVDRVENLEERGGAHCTAAHSRMASPLVREIPPVSRELTKKLACSTSLFLHTFSKTIRARYVMPKNSIY